MKAVILAGGLGTRLAEETDARPKPMVEIGGQPILWHIMKHYAAFAFKEFVLALGWYRELFTGAARRAAAEDGEGPVVGDGSGRRCRYLPVSAGFWSGQRIPRSD